MTIGYFMLYGFWTCFGAVGVVGAACFALETIESRSVRK